jgi:hypothetical protein
MTKITSIALSTTFIAMIASSAYAQSAQIPTPANPNPMNPIATNGSPLPHNNTGRDVVYTGRSAFAPVTTVLGYGVDAAGTIVTTGANVAGEAVNAGVGTAGSIIGR